MMGDKMSLQERISGDLKTAMKNKDRVRIDAVRVLIGEFQRQPEKTLSDDQVAGIIRKLIKAERELLAAARDGDSGFIGVLEEYLPKQADEAEIMEWITTHIDFSDFNNKMQAMKPIMAHFGSNADGNMVKKILQNFDG